MRRVLTIIALAAFATVLGLGVSPASAASPHFIQATAAGPADDGSLEATFRIAGLGDTVTTTVTLSASATATFACRNNGGNFPEDPKKEQITGPVTAAGQFTSGHNGQVTGTLTLTPPVSTLDCPPGQSAVLAEVAYSNVQVSEPAAGSESIAGVFARTFYEI